MERLGTQVKMNDNSFLEIMFQLADGNSRFGSRFRNKREIWSVWGLVFKKKKSHLEGCRQNKGQISQNDAYKYQLILYMS